MYIFKSTDNKSLNRIRKGYFSKNSKLTGSIIAPGDKSISQRAIIISLASIGTTIIKDPLDSEDVYHTLKVHRLPNIFLLLYLYI